MAGLFNAKIGGTQYVDEFGNALFAFNDDKNLVLFPQFEAKEYTLILDYQGAPVTGIRSINVSYDSLIQDLPLDILIDHKTFTGWYTKPNSEGTQIADKYGILPENSRISEELFDLSKSNIIYLYAGFENAKYNVTLYFDDSSYEEVSIEYGTNIKDVVPKTRINGNAVLSWSKIKNDINKEYIFTGEIRENLVLYATEYAPVIDFEENGGEDIIPLVARAGSSISLPVPVRETYRFIEWQDENGNAYLSTQMPSESMTLKAIWQAKLVFDENGGTDVDDISKPVGESISLPIPQKDGYIFAGWYTENKERFESKTMPLTGTRLKAGWYTEKTVTSVLVSDTMSLSIANYPSWTAEHYRKEFEIDLLKLDEGISIPKSMNINVQIHFKSKHSSDDTYPSTVRCVISETTELNTSTIHIDKTYLKNGISSYQTMELNTQFDTTEGKFYLIFISGAENDSSAQRTINISDVYVTINYPDTSLLYLD